MLIAIELDDFSINAFQIINGKNVNKSQPIIASQNSLWSPGFQGLLWTNFLTATNDNIFRWFVIGIGKDMWGPEHASTVLSLGLAAFVIPYLLLATTAGWLADRFQKRKVIIACKVAEIVVMVLGMAAVLLGSLQLLMFTVFLMGAQSALFAPSKVGTIPELLDEDKISVGNGWFNLTSLTATIIGMLIGAALADVCIAAANVTDNLWIAAATVIGMAVIGTLVSFLIVSMPAANPKLKYPYNWLAATWRDLCLLGSDAKLFRVALGIAFFWSFAALGQTNIDMLSVESGGIREMERLPLLISLILGVGGGSILAGIASRGRIELGLVPWGAVGMIVFSVLIFFAPEHFIDGTIQRIGLWFCCLCLFLLGISAGFFDVPLASYIQHHSPPEKRGQILAANNFMLFSAMLLISVLYMGLRTPFYEGSVENLKPAWSGKGLELADQKIIHGSRIEFANKLKNGVVEPEQWPEFLPEKDSDVYLQTAAALMHPAMLAEKAQIKLDNANRGTDDPYQKFSTDKYIEVLDKDNDEHQRVVEHVNRQAGKTALLSARQVFLVMALMAFPALCYSSWRVAPNMLRVFTYWTLRLFYRLDIRGMENIPETGPAVVIGNHQSWVDAMLIMMTVNRKMRTVAHAGNFGLWPLKVVARVASVILITGGPKTIVRALKEARKSLDDGELVCLFPEGGISKTTQIRKFKPGLYKILDEKHKDIPIIPVYMDEIWGTGGSYSKGKPFFKWPTSWRHPITIHVGKPMKRPDDIYDLRQHLQEMGANIVPERQGPFVSPTQRFVRQCKRRKFKFKIGDSMGQTATGGNLLMRTLILRRLLEREGVFAEQNIGVLIPPTVGGVIVNAALAMEGKVSVNLNYSVSNEILNDIIAQSGIKTILSTRKVMEKMDFDLKAEIVYLDDFKDKVTTGDKVAGAVGAYLKPSSMLESKLGLKNASPDDLVTMIFTSGSTGNPKGVMLSNGNIENNVDGIERVARLTSKDVMVGVLPFFHSFGYTVTMWSVLANDIAGCYHFSPLDAKQVGKLVKKYGGTILLATPTFLRTYSRRCTEEEFASLDLVVAGAERLPLELCDSFEKKFGIRPAEGYGATELSPLVSVNVPKSRQNDKFQIDIKEGTVGRPIPNVAARITHLDSGEVLGVNQSGMLWIKGPNVMLGYLEKPELTADVIQDGWYKTGDVALIDEDGFIKITGRISRFSKIGGEMVPHVKVEEILMQLIGDDDDEPNIAVTSVADEKKGERLIVLHTEMPKTPSELRKGLSEAGLPNIFIPSEDSFLRVESLPVLGSGKLDLKALKMMAEEMVG